MAKLFYNNYTAGVKHIGSSGLHVLNHSAFMFCYKISLLFLLFYLQ